MSKTVKKYRWVILKFCVTGLVLISGFSLLIDYGVRHSDYAQTGKVNKIVNHAVDPGIMIFGSSVSEVGINPAILGKKTGLTVYNCSLDGTRFMQYKGLIEEFQSYSKNNKYIILSETYFSFEGIDAINEAERYLAQLSNQKLYYSLYRMQPDLLWKCRYVPFYKYVAVTHVYYKNSIIGWKNILRGAAYDSSCGFTPADRQWEMDADEALRNMKPFSVRLDSFVLQNYAQTIQSLQQSGKKVIIILTPTYKEVLKITDPTPLRKKLAEISATTGARFLDFSLGMLSTEKQYFYNSTHLNSRGANTFSAMLADSLDAMVHGAPSH